jgi:hypothetical protein
VKLRLGRVAKDWGELAAILRQAAAEPGPASSNTTEVCAFAANRLANTHPAAPPLMLVDDFAVGPS